MADLRVLGPVVRALISSNYYHPGVVRTLLMVREYVLSCGCRRGGRVCSQPVAMTPARLIWPWEFLEMDLQDMKHVSSAWIVVDRVSRFLFTYPLESKGSVGVVDI